MYLDGWFGMRNRRKLRKSGFFFLKFSVSRLMEINGQELNLSALVTGEKI